MCDSVYMQTMLKDINLPLIITFEPLCSGVEIKTIDPRLYTIPSFKFIQKLGYNVISFVHEKNTYYRSLEFIRFVKDLSKDLEIFTSKIGYGNSLGGFASALYANDLHLERCLLLMPQSTFCGTIAPWERHSVAACKHEDWNTDYSDASVCNVHLTIIYDPLYPCDVKHIKRFSNVTPIRLYGVGHRVPRALKHLGLLSNVVDSYISTGSLPEHFYEMSKKRRYLKYYLKNIIKNPTKKLSLKKRFFFFRLYFKLAVTRKFLCSHNRVNIK